MIVEVLRGAELGAQVLQHLLANPHAETVPPPRHGAKAFEQIGLEVLDDHRAPGLEGVEQSIVLVALHEADDALDRRHHLIVRSHVVRSQEASSMLGADAAAGNGARAIA